MLDAQNAAPLPCHCRTAAVLLPRPFMGHRVPKVLLIKIVVFVYVLCKNSENAINLSLSLSLK
jgi:hypothetical protein